MKPIDQVNDDFLSKGVFVLVDMNGRTLRFFGYKKDGVAIKQMIDSLKGRGPEMVKFLVTSARAQGVRP